MSKIKSTTVIVRECGERTADICYQALIPIFGYDSVFRVSEKPFSKTLRKSLELGVSVGNEFTLCIDADVIPIEEGVNSLIAEMHQQPSHVLELQGMVYDNLFRIQRPAGNHLYRTCLAERAIRNIPVEGTSLRPESDMLSALTRRGNPWVQSKSLVGYHDFEQELDDVYRKAFLHGRKHNYFREYLSDLWESLAGEHVEFKVALAALRDSKDYDGIVRVDKAFLRGEIETRLKQLGVKELGFLQTFPDVLPICDMNIALRDSLREARNRCEKELHNMIFSSNSARLRQLLALPVFQILFS